MPNPQCTATTRTGARCEAHALPDSAYCFHHDPARAAERRAARSRGGRARHGRSIGPTGATPPPDLRSNADVVALLQDAIHHTLQLENSLQRARTLGYLAGLLVRALDLAALEDRIDRLEQVLKTREPNQ